MPGTMTRILFALALALLVTAVIVPNFALAKPVFVEFSDRQDDGLVTFSRCRTRCLRRQFQCATMCEKICNIVSGDQIGAACKGYVQHCSDCWEECQSDLRRCFISNCYPDDKSQDAVSDDENYDHRRRKITYDPNY